MANQSTIAIELTVNDNGSVVVKQFAANTEKALGEAKSSTGGLSGSLSTLQENWMGLSAAAFAAWAVMNKAIAWAEIGAKAQQANDSFRAVAASYNVNADELIAASKRAAGETVGNTMIMQKAMKAMTQDIDPTRIPELFETARVAARISGMDVADAADVIIDATANQMPRALRQFGLVSKEEMGVFNKAIAAGVEDTKILELVLITGKIRMAELGGVAKTDAERFQEFHIEVSSLTKTIGGWTLDVLRGVYGAFSLLASGTLYAAGGIMNLVVAFEELSAKVQSGAGAEQTRRIAKEHQAIANDFMGAADGLTNKTLDLFEKNHKAENTYTQEELANFRAKKQALLDDLTARTAADKAKDDIDLYSFKAEEDRIKSLNEMNKNYYEAAIAGAEHNAKMQQESGQYELTTINDLAEARSLALNNWRDQAIKNAEEEVALEDKKAKTIFDTDAAMKAKIDGIDSEYTKKYQDGENKRIESTGALAKKHIEIEASAYKTINQYSDESIRAEISNLEEKLRQDKRYTDNRALLEAALNTQINQLYLKRDKVVLDYYDKTTVYAGDADKIIMSLADEEYKKAYDATKSVMVAEKAKTDFIIDQNLKRAAAGNDFWAGMTAQYDKDQANLTTWGKAGVETMKAMSTSMASSFSTLFEDVYQGKLKNLGDYAGAIWDATRQKYFEMVGKMAAETVMVYFKTAWSETGTQVLSLLTKILGLTGVDTELPTGDVHGVDSIYYDGGRVNYTSGGEVAGTARYPGNHPGNDTVPAWLSPDEMVIRRTSVNPYTTETLDYINHFGRVPAMYNGGSVAGMVTDQPNKGYWGFSDFVNIITGGASNVLGITNSHDFVSDVIGSFLDPAGTAILAGADYVVHGNIYQGVDRALDPGGIIDTAVREIGKNLPDSIRENGPALGSLIGSLIYPGYGTMAGYGIGSKIRGDSYQMGARGASISLAASAASGATSGYVKEVTGSEIAAKIAGYLAGTLTRYGISQARANFLSDEILQGKIKTSFAGFGNIDFLESLSDLNGMVGMNKAFSARNGLDYVPRDNYLINAHEGEAVLPENEAKEWRRGANGGNSRPILVTVPIQIDRKTICSLILETSRTGELKINGRAVRANA